MTMHLADLAKFDIEQWTASIKIDGHRAHPIVDERGLIVQSRHNKKLDVSQTTLNAIKDLKLPFGTMLDAEWTGRRTYRNEELHIFDVMWWNNSWVGSLPFESRIEIIKSINLSDPIHLVKNFQDDFIGLMRSIIGDYRTEGVVLKKRGFTIPRLLRDSKDIAEMVKIKWRDGPSGLTIVIKNINGQLTAC